GDGVPAWHHPVALPVCHQYWMGDGGEVCWFLESPAVDGFQLGAESPQGDGLVAVVGAFLQPSQELLPGPAPVGCPGEEEELLGVLAGEQCSRRVEVGDAGHLVDAFAPRGAGSGE